MAKKVTEIDEYTGKIVTGKVTRRMRKSEQRLIPLTPAPKTRAQKVARSLWG